MRRLTAVIAALLLFMLTALNTTASKSGTLYAKYVPRSETGTLFYIDIYCSAELRSADLQLTYDSSAVEYREISATDKNAYAKAKSAKGSVRILFTDSSSVKGQLCRLSFKALTQGDTELILHDNGMVGGDLKYLSGVPDSALTISLGKEDIVSDTDNSGSDKQSGKSSKTSYGGSDSKKESSTEATDETSAADPVKRTVEDASHNEGLTYFLLGAGAMLLAGLLILLGYVIGKRKKPVQKAIEKEPDSPDKEELPAE